MYAPQLARLGTVAYAAACTTTLDRAIARLHPCLFLLFYSVFLRLVKSIIPVVHFQKLASSRWNDVLNMLYKVNESSI